MRPFSENKGLTLVEAIMSVMIMAMAAVAIASVIISTTMAYKKSELKQTAIYMINTASEKLRDFVVDAPSDIPASIRNGGTGYDGLCAEFNASGSGFPLASGTTWDLSCYFDMPYGTGNAATLADVFPGAGSQQFVYRVEDFICTTGVTCKKVEFTINYTTD